MGLGISMGRNVGAMSILSNLNRTQGTLSRILEQQSTGRRINRASDDPSGLVISEQLRAQIGGLGAAIQNTNFADSAVRTAESGLGQVSDQLIGLRSLAVRAAGAQTSQERQALQAAADATTSSITRIAGTTRFGGQNLLNGSQDIRTSNVSGNLENVDVNTANLGSTQASRTLNVTVNATATQAQTTETINSAAAASTNGATLRLTGATGSQTIEVAAGATGQDVIGAINAVSATTGVQAVDAGGGEFRLESTDVGTAQTVTAEIVQGDFAFTGAAPGQTVVSATGTNANVTVNGAQAATAGNTVTFDTGGVTGNFGVKAGTAAGSQESFRVERSGFRSQVGAGANDAVTVGIDSADASSLGLSNIDLVNDPTAALAQIDAAIAKVSTQRSELGSLSSNTFGPAVSNLSTQFTNLTATESSIRDLDFASSLMQSQSSRVQFQAQVSLLRQHNALTGGSLLRLLGSK